MSGAIPPPPRRLLRDADVDRVAMALFALAREVAVLADRQILLEHLLESHGIAVAAIETAQPDEALRARLDARADAIVAAVVDALAAPPGDG